MRKLIIISVVLAISACTTVNEVELPSSYQWEVISDQNDLRIELFAIGPSYLRNKIDDIYMLNPNNFELTKMLTEPARQPGKWQYIKSKVSGKVYKYHLTKGEIIRIPGKVIMKD
jgi:hypothetical protein